MASEAREGDGIRGGRAAAEQVGRRGVGRAAIEWRHQARHRPAPPRLLRSHLRAAPGGCWCAALAVSWVGLSLSRLARVAVISGTYECPHTSSSSRVYVLGWLAGGTAEWPDGAGTGSGWSRVGRFDVGQWVIVRFKLGTVWIVGGIKIYT